MIVSTPGRAVLLWFHLVGLGHTVFRLRELLILNVNAERRMR